MRLIDADALPRHGQRGGLVYWRDIENAPTIKAWTRADHNADAFHAYVEGKKSATKHGKWLGIGRTAVTCSLCGAWTETAGNYCPNCGAKMDGGDENEAD